MGLIEMLVGGVVVVVVIGFAAIKFGKKKTMPKPDIMRQNVEYKQRYPNRATILESQYLKDEEENEDKRHED